MNIKGGVIAYNELFWGTDAKACFKNTYPSDVMFYDRLAQYRANELDTFNIVDIDFPIKYGFIGSHESSLPQIYFDGKLEKSKWGKAKLIPLTHYVNLNCLEKYANRLGRAVGIIDKMDNISTFSEKGFIAILFSSRNNDYKTAVENWQNKNKNFLLNFSNSFNACNLPFKHGIAALQGVNLRDFDLVFIPFYSDGVIIENDSDLMKNYLEGIIHKKNQGDYLVERDYFLNNFISGINTSQDDDIIDFFCNKTALDLESIKNKIDDIDLFRFLVKNIKTKLGSYSVRVDREYEESYYIASSGLDLNIDDIYLTNFNFHPNYGKQVGHWGYEKKVKLFTDKLRLNFIENYSATNHFKSLCYQEAIKKLIK